MRKLIGRVGAALLLLVATASGSWAADWVVMQSVGTVWLVAPDASATSPAVGTVVEPGWTVGTGPASRVLLVNGEETMAIGPDTVMMFRALGRATLVLEQQGEITFEVNERNVRNFTVQTPLLAAVVKGTTFTVSADAAAAAVLVNGGSVEVRSFASGEMALLQAGQGALVASDNPQLTVFGAGALPAVVQGRAGRSLVPASPTAIAGGGGVVEDDDAQRGNAYAFGRGNGNEGPGNGNGGGGNGGAGPNGETGGTGIEGSGDESGSGSGGEEEECSLLSLSVSVCLSSLL